MSKLKAGWAFPRNWAVLVWGRGEGASVVHYARYNDALNACQRTVDHGKCAYLVTGPNNPGEHPSGYFQPGSNVRWQVGRE